MTQPAPTSHRLRGWIVLMRPRAPGEAYRASTPLELLFDQVFMIAVAQTWWRPSPRSPYRWNPSPNASAQLPFAK
jgi:hypothetical protein